MRKQGIQITEQHFLKFLYTYPKININKKQFFLEDDLDFLLPYAEKNIVEITKIKVQLFNHLGITPNIDTLLYCISTINIDLASEIMRKHNVNPTKRCLDLAIKNKCTNEFIFQILSYKITPDSETIECISCENKNLIALLQKHGLKISLNDIDVLLSKKIVLDDLSILGIEYDEDIYFMYYKYKCLTDDQLEKFTKISQIVNFRKMFLNKKLTEKGMLREMKKNNLHVDQYCISNVYFVNNRKLIKYLEERYHCSTSIMAQKKPIAYDILKNITPEIMIAEVERKC